MVRVLLAPHAAGHPVVLIQNQYVPASFVSFELMPLPCQVLGLYRAILQIDPAPKSLQIGEQRVVTLRIDLHFVKKTGYRSPRRSQKYQFSR